MTRDDLNMDELFELTERQCEDVATDDELRRLNALLAESEDSRRRYLAHMQLHGEMHWQSTGAADRISTDPQNASIPQGAGPVGRIAPIAMSIAAALVFTAAVVMIYLLASSLSTTDSTDPDAATPIATLVDTVDATVVYEDDIANPGGEYAAGEYVVESGSAQFQLTSGTSVQTRGDTRLIMHGDMRATLMRGTVSVVCPARAKGFTISLPDGSRVVDLGTAFRVSLDESGRARVTVSSGRVRIDDPAGRSLTELTAGLGAAVASGKIVESIASQVLFSESFDTDAAHVGEVATAYPKFTRPRQAVVSDGVLRLIDAQQAMTITAEGATGGAYADFFEPTGSYTVTARVGAAGGAPVAYSSQVVFAANAAIEFGRSDGSGNEFFRVIAVDFPNNRSSLGNVAAQVADIGFDIVDGELYDLTITVTRRADDSVTIDATLVDAGSNAAFTMETLTIRADDVEPFLGRADTIGIAKRGTDPGSTIAERVSVSTVQFTTSPASGEAKTGPRGSDE